MLGHTWFTHDVRVNSAKRLPDYPMMSVPASLVAGRAKAEQPRPTFETRENAVTPKFDLTVFPEAMVGWI